MGEQDTPTEPGWYSHRYGDEGRESYWDGWEWTGEPRAQKRHGWAWVLASLGILVGLFVAFIGVMHFIGELLLLGLGILGVSLLGAFALQVDTERRTNKTKHGS